MPLALCVSGSIHHMIVIFIFYKVLISGVVRKGGGGGDGKGKMAKIGPR